MTVELINQIEEFATTPGNMIFGSFGIIYESNKVTYKKGDLVLCANGGLINFGPSVKKPSIDKHIYDGSVDIRIRPLPAGTELKLVSED